MMRFITLSGGQTSVSNDAASYSTGVSRLLPFGGTVSFDFTGSRSATSNVYSTYNPSFSSALGASITQPLLRGLRFDTTRAAIAQADISRGIADVELRQQVASTLAAVRRAYWELVYAADALETARRSEALAVQQQNDSQRRVDLGTVAPIEILESEAEVASRHQATVQADGAWRDAQVALKQLIVANAGDGIWNATIIPADRPDTELRTIDVPAAVARALAARRLEAEQARRDVGLSTTFLVLQAQRDLATSETSELRAQLDYRTALVTFDLVQEAPG